MDWSALDRGRAAWALLGLVLAVSLLLVFYSFVGTFVFGLFLYYATRPVYRRLKRHIYPPSLAAAVSIFVLALPALLLLVYVVLIALQEVSSFTSAENADLGPLEPYVTPYFDLSSEFQNPQELLNDPNNLSLLEGGTRQLLDSVGFIGNGLFHLFIMLALAFYLLRDGPRLSRWVRNRFADDRGVFEQYARAVDTDFASVFFGNILNAIMTGLIGAIAYTLLNEVAPGTPVPYPTLLGLLTGVASLIPVVGMKLVYLPVTGYLVYSGLPELDNLWFVAVFFAVSFVVVDSIPDFLLRPYVSGRNLHIGMVMFAYIFGPLLFGWYGIFLGPIVLVLAYNFASLVLPELLAGEEMTPYAVDPGAMTAQSLEERTTTEPLTDDPTGEGPAGGASADGTD
ncbi:AI-2E family transporter [Halomarina oriensis]|uniref:AI-2E family transporter n=1 Tax=Halomarina oriensis TaxID=671145 RepID=A0A6B0GY81_9EURY|nr:AI-2E family transporter [Halomarina oriensis]MWG36748.1 AI-2E family transporter [Halomarina oriensis]